MQPAIEKYSSVTRKARTRRRPWLLVVAALAVLGGIFRTPLKHGAYVTARAAAITEAHLKLAGWPMLKTAHFWVYYRPGQKSQAKLVLKALQQALPFEESNLNESLHHPLSVALYPTALSMNRAVGEPGSADNIGYEYDGIIDILSPSAWLGSNSASIRAFLKQGPAAHELGHALLDLKADMNYPHWFNEGVAQYLDYRVTGYQWLTPSNALTGPLYSMAQLNNNFYSLANQSRAYREGLGLVEYLETVHGHNAFTRFLNQLAQGTSFSQALSRDYHFSTENALFQAWQSSLTQGAA